MSRGLSLIVFPEGTRSRDGRVARFKGGSFYLALEAGLPIVPLSVIGSRHVMLKGRLATYPGRVGLAASARVPAGRGAGGQSGARSRPTCRPPRGRGSESVRGRGRFPRRARDT